VRSRSGQPARLPELAKGEDKPKFLSLSLLYFGEIFGDSKFDKFKFTVSD
jgi:hypothetical protein